MSAVVSVPHPSTRLRDSSTLLRRVAAWEEHPALEGLSVDVLREVTRVHGIDWATALLFDRLSRSPRHAGFIADVDATLRPWREIDARLDADIVIAPAAFYIEYPDIGGDGRVLVPVAEHLGCRVTLAPCGSGASLAENARILADTLRAMRGRRVILVSLSKGGADVRALMEMPGVEEALRPVVAWVDFCGIAFGTPLAERIVGSYCLSALARAMCWLRGHDFRFISDLAELRARPALNRSWVPPGIQAIHAVCFPLAQDISHARARRHYARMSPLGPNDACGLLGEAAAMPGRIYPIWAVDHYVRPAWDIGDLVAALLLRVAAMGVTPTTDRV